ncbi:MAG TPA: hypothetical protein VF641_00470 [Methylobacterium sp.]|jgi:hypothetical protein
MDGSSVSLTGYFLPLGLLASVVAWNLARHKGRSELRWAIGCFLFFPVLIVLAFAKSRQRPADSGEFRQRWTSLVAYDPAIKAAVERLSTLGPAAVEQFRMAYGDVQTKESVPLIVADIEGRWAAGDRFDGKHEHSERLEELHRRGVITDADYEDQKRRLVLPRRPRRPWTGWWWKAPALLLLIVLFWPRGTPAGFPSCEASATREIVRRAIEEGEDAKVRNTRLLALDEVKELSHDPAKPERYCGGLAALNSGDRRITWRLFQRGTNLFVEVSGS